ncbi:MAG: hypothetical protein AAFY98_10240 [Verrucomicrobiota bacterium]
MQGKRISIFIGVSILLHLFLFLIMSTGILNAFAWKPEEPEPEPLKVRLVPKPPPEQQALDNLPKEKPYVDSSESIPTDAPDPNSAFQSDQNIMASSRSLGVGSESAPNLTGERAGFNLNNTPYVPESKQQPVPPAPEMPDPDQEVKKQQEEQEATTLDPLRNIPRAPDSRILTREENDRKIAQELLEEQKRKIEAMSQNRPNTPAMQFQAQRRQSNLPGGAEFGPEDSFGANETELGRYKEKLYRAIGSRWYAYVDKSRGQVELGQIVLTFRVTADGIIEDIAVDEGRGQGALYAISRRSIDEVSGQIGPFPESMRQQLGKSYEEKISFTVH